ncbi:Phospholipase/carboxylesterase/thioesterase [Dipodascopsis uninucleata]
MSAVRVPAIAEHTATVIFMHGLGDSGSGWKFLADEYRRNPAFNHVSFVFPNAPKQKVTLNFGLEMPSWFDITSLDKVEAREDVKGINESVGRMRSFIKEELDKGIKPERIVIGGFSQGCVISLMTGLTSDIKLGGVVGLSGFMAQRSSIVEMHKKAAVKIPYFVGHGTNDPVVKYEYCLLTKQILESLNMPLEFHEYPGLTHSVSPTEIEHISTFLQRVIPK